MVKYSIEDLPSDAWDVRRTKQVARAILRAKTSLNVTTGQLAERCNHFLGDPEAVKTSTLNGLFAGKRRAISSTELEMFSAVLMVSVLELLYPTGEMIEIRPGSVVSSSDALVGALGVTFVIGQHSVYNGGRDATVLEVVQRAHMVDTYTGRTIHALRSWGPEHSQSRINLEQLRYAASNLNARIRALASLGETPPTIPASASWALGLNEEAITGEFILSAVEPLFAGKGISIGDYRLGGTVVEHPEAS
ncbi:MULTISPECIES: hypothetical protein [unclassified Cryobacterium]|uniref:hypothetical protein n=1 Tax=unclassified Cryobacterium TaxID=2649013 RepID=UPI00106C9686|nr:MULTISPECIES: hypothetical protein [unclassified Cryobacterium]TFC00261.1 hypothetical protein E3O39_01750 [Cryobacterium sp. MDB2-A-1]TFC14125.1 hypothetical protein E3O35_04020 [Cryobacterium sp. MDB2-A-2]